MITKNGQNTNITEEEAELYDRQIRLWGLDSQKRLRQARILLFGLGGLGTEVAKNVILAGVKSLMLMDNAVVTDTDVATNFTLTEGNVGKNRALCAMPNIQKLNPMVEVTTDTSDIKDKDEEFFKQFDVVCVLSCSQKIAEKVDSICHENQIHFMTGDCFGFYGFAFSDLGTHEFSEEVPNKPKKKVDATAEPTAKKRKTETVDEDSITVVKKTIKFNQLTQALEGKDTTKKSPGLFDLLKTVWNFKDVHGCLPTISMDEGKRKSLDDMVAKIDETLQSKPALSMDNILNHTSGEFSPTCAIIGGIIGQEVIKAVSQKDAPLNNFFLFDGTEGSGYAQQFAP